MIESCDMFSGSHEFSGTLLQPSLTNNLRHRRNTICSSSHEYWSVF